MQLPLYHDHTFRVRYAETDQMGVVHNAVYPVWFEMGRTEYSYARGFSYSQIEEAGYALAVAEMVVRYKRPARYDDMVTVRTWISKNRRKMIEFSYEIRHADSGQLLASGHSTHISIVFDTFKPAPLPEEMRKHFPVWENPE